MFFAPSCTAASQVARARLGPGNGAETDLDGAPTVPHAMKLTRPRLLSLLLAASAAAWPCLLALQRHYVEGPNYSRIEDGLYLGGFVDAPPPGTRAVVNLCEQDDPY